MQRHYRSMVESWGTKAKFSLPAYLWYLFIIALLALLTKIHSGAYLVPPFLATLSLIHLLPDAPISQPYAVIVGSVAGTGVGVLMTFFGYGPFFAGASAAIAFIAIHWLRAYHPPGVALALYPALLHVPRLFPFQVVLPFTLVAVGSAALFSRLSPHWPKYPLPLGKVAPAPWSNVD